MKDFELAQGEMKAGLKTAIASALLFAVIPFFILTFLTSMMSGVLSPDDRMFREALLQLRGILLPFSIPVVVLGFFASYYLKGTRSRLLFACLSALAILAYAFAMFLGTDLRSALQAIGVALDLQLLFLLALIGVALLTLRYLGTYLRFRPEWLRSVGVETSPITRQPRVGMAEFDLANGSFCRGNASAKSAGIWFAVVPALSLMLVAFFGSIITDSTDPALTSFLAVLGDMAWMAALLSLPLILLAWFRGFYPRGSLPRMTFGVAFALLTAVYLYFLLIQTGLQASLADLGFVIDVESIFLMLLLLVAFLLLKSVGEMADERKNWKRDVGLKVESKTLDPDSRWADLEPRYGKFEKGFKEGQRALLCFIVLPVIVLTILPAILASLHDPIATSFVPILQAMIGVALLCGIPVVVLGFAKGCYPKGSGGRTMFALLMMAFIGVYLFALLLGGELEAAISAAGLPLDLDPIWGLLLVLVLFHGVMDLAELADYRRQWKVAIGRKVEPVQEEESHGLMLDFRPRYGRYLVGAKGAKSALKKYLIWPSISIIVLIAVIQVLMDQFSLSQLSVIADDLRSITGVLLIFIIPVMVLTFLRGFYPKGSISRLSFAWGLCAALAFWLWSITLAGKFALDLEVQGATVGVQLDLSGIILILMALQLLWGLYYTAEFVSYRKDWIKNSYQPVDERVKRPRPLKPVSKA